MVIQMSDVIFELLWLFLSYSFAGWILETIASVFKKRRLANRGLVNGPFCIIYGATASILTICTVELSVFWIFIGSMVLATLTEWASGHWIEKAYHERWWDYSDIKWNLDGYICAPMSIFWGLLGALGIKFGNPFLLSIFHLLPGLLGKILVLIVFGILALDIAASLIVLSGRSKAQENWQSVDDWLTGVSTRFGKWICKHVDSRIQRAYPDAREKEKQKAKEPEMLTAEYSFYHIFLLFVIGAFLGDIVETLFCRLKMGVWMSRSSLVWEPFSVVWGIALAGITVLLYKYRNRSESFLFCVGVLLGGTYEYICSVFTEIVFGKVFWDYSGFQFNLGGRVNLLYSFFWGIAAIVWFKLLYGFFSRLIEKILIKAGKAVVWALVVFMGCNILVSCMALVRYDERSRDIPAESSWQKVMDERFGDERMARIYPKAKIPEYPKEK